ncbi:MAG: reverse transcriptase/maturase family protein [Anaerolineae bacterium]|nr:reverse transcriptase/maturase family protein [Anaerolineae bacterium]
MRILTILTVTDRVLQRAVLNVLEPVFERKFLDCSYGYRPGRGVGDAVERIVAFRDKGFSWVLDADIDDCFPSFDHGLLRHSWPKTSTTPTSAGSSTWLVQMQGR